jgi:hypothetical protein
MTAHLKINSTYVELISHGINDHEIMILCWTFTTYYYQYYMVKIDLI